METQKPSQPVQPQGNIAPSSPGPSISQAVRAQSSPSPTPSNHNLRVVGQTTTPSRVSSSQSGGSYESNQGSGGGNLTKVALVLFILAFILAGVVAYVAYTQNKKASEQLARIQQLESENSQARDEASKYQKLFQDREEEFKLLEAKLVNLDENRKQLDTRLMDIQQQLDAKVQEASQLEKEKAALSKEKEGLASLLDITTRSADELNNRLLETDQKLSALSKDNEFLVGELSNIAKQKADLEKKFNDYAELKKHFRTVKVEHYKQKRLDWMREGYVGGKKGAAEHVRRPKTEESPALKADIFSPDAETKSSASSAENSGNPAPNQ